MLPEDILSNATVRLSEAERRHYFESGYVSVDSAISSEWIAQLRAATAELLEASRAETESGTVFVLEEGHTGESPRLHRVPESVEAATGRRGAEDVGGRCRVRRKPVPDLALQELTCQP